MKLRHLFFACSGVFVMMFSLLLLVVIVFSDEEDGGSGGNLIYGGVSVSQEVLAHKPMLEKYAREYGIEAVSYTHLMLGRQAGFFLILACQRPDAKYLGDGIRDQFNFRVALGLSLIHISKVYVGIKYSFFISPYMIYFNNSIIKFVY